MAHYVLPGLVKKDDYRDKPIDFIDPAPKPFIVQIPLVEYFERMTGWKADPWQVDLCARLQAAAENRHIRGSRDVFGAEPQLGKTIIISQHLPPWLMGHDPLFKFALAMYNSELSERHSKIVIRIMQSELHRQIFPNKDGWLFSGTPAVSGWYTNAGMEGNAGQFSFNPVGLLSGITGTGPNWIGVDDPYRSEADAFSLKVNKSIRDFLDFLEARLGLHTNLSLMFHRYAHEDAAGYCLDQGDFNYTRYATECDGDYIHESTGQRFPDPMGRKMGEFISPRRGPAFYEKVRKKPRVWLAMNQQRPTIDGGSFFLVNKIETINEAQGRAEWLKCVAITRSWDHAATQGKGDWTAGALLGIQADGTVIVKDMRLVQLDSAERIDVQKEVAEEDGVTVPICVPQEVGEAGKTLVFAMRQFLKGYTVIPRHVVTTTQAGSHSVNMGSNPKERRAYNFSIAVNASQVKFISDGGVTEDRKWHKETLRALRNFGFTTFDDPVDALGDGYNYIFEELGKGLVIKSQPRYETRAEPIPIHWTLYIGVKITDMLNVPNSGVIVARAAENSGLTDTLFIVDEYKEHEKPFEDIFTWIDRSLEKHIAKPVNGDKPNKPVIYLHPDSEDYIKTIRSKLKYQVRLFDQGDSGLPEANWYAQNDKLVGLGDLPNVKQEAATWGFNDKGEPNGIGQVWDCLRMITYAFRTRAIGLSPQEQFEKEMLEKGLALDTINEVESEQDKLALLQVRTIESRKFAQEQKPGYKRVGVPNRFRRR